MTPEASADATLELEWHHLHARYALLSCALDRALGEYGLGVSDFEVLDRLSSAPKARVQELASSVHLSQSALSRVVARLERDGLVERAMCPDDRRGIFVAITSVGRARHAEAAPTRQRVLTEHLSGPAQENHEGCVCLS
ncbi:MarR family winged helix-turn-helix transcriptional regulator [Tenggerimyces flavus]|uniref:MarR family winged helix-turn-helix transcriptional regulator n=1 Tax=Tenggerimyces flavus TaxID=1708749 RepID=A0ABV7YEF5_9ACTN|nr:MarR family transcriptional regulator [Tenggerimyces flavus]MBM7788118.1 DNA-binding MarR family transcriptional regulator [Tenggerimyces flavus]